LLKLQIKIFDGEDKDVPLSTLLVDASSQSDNIKGSWDKVKLAIQNSRIDIARGELYYDPTSLLFQEVCGVSCFRNV
jgi:hypothetical protein